MLNPVIVAKVIQNQGKVFNNLFFYQGGSSKKNMSRLNLVV
jgi:hypothetical protein